MKTRISNSIEGATEYIRQFVERLNDEDHIRSIPEYDFESVIDSLVLNFHANNNLQINNIDEIENNEAKSEAERINSVIGQQANNFIYQTAIDNVAESILETISQSLEFDEQLFYNLCKLLDLLIHITPKTTNTIFFRLVSNSMETLFNSSVEHALTLWDYVESRQTLIESTVISNSRTSDRIALLELCNAVSDRFYAKTGKGMFDAYKEDTFNDRLKFRVRSFLASMLKLEDNTGLNKYFTAGNRIAADMVTQKTREGNFVKDIIQINKMFRDPYYYVRPANHLALSKNIDLLNKVYQYLMDEETKYHRNIPKVDIFAIPPDKTEAEAADLRKKYKSKRYYPEHYWLSQFEELKKGATFEDLKQQDQDYIYKLFDSPKTRQIFLLQIFILCSFFYEMVPKNKREFLKEINAPANVKHISDDFIPDRLLNILYKFKREFPRLYRSIDPQFSYLVQAISNSESFWWAWLIYGKNASGKSYFADRVLAQEEFAGIEEKLKLVILFREKRYFNTYATPQLSRRMKVQTGMLQLKSGFTPEDLSSQIDELNDKIANGDTGAIEKRDVLLWRHLKQTRPTQWLNFGSLLTKEMFPVDEINEMEEKKEQEKGDEKKIENPEDEIGTKRPHSDDEEPPKKPKTDATGETKGALPAGGDTENTDNDADIKMDTAPGEETQN